MYFFVQLFTCYFKISDKLNSESFSNVMISNFIKFNTVITYKVCVIYTIKIITIYVIF